jgi:hypothetical protein
MEPDRLRKEKDQTRRSLKPVSVRIGTNDITGDTQKRAANQATLLKRQCSQLEPAIRLLPGVE